MTNRIEMQIIVGPNSEVIDAVVGYSIDLEGNCDSAWAISGCPDSYVDDDVIADINEYLKDERG